MPARRAVVAHGLPPVGFFGTIAFDAPPTWWNHPMNRVPPSAGFFLLLLGFAGGTLVERGGFLSRSDCPSRSTLEPFCEAWGIVKANYVDRQAVQPQKMTAGAIQGMLASLGDFGHTTYLSATDLKELENSLEGHFTGIGARMTMRKERPTVVQVMPGSPAQNAGVKPGDVLTEVNGKDVHGLPLSRIVELVRGPAGSTVELQVSRPGTPKPLDLRIMRAKVPIEDVVWHMLPGTRFAHLAIQEFGVDADRQLREAVQQLKEQGARGIILDLRGNPGGVKDQAVAVTSEFLTSGLIFWEQNAQGHRKANPVVPGGVAAELPLCVLIDEGTASSAEICAGAIQDHDRGTLIGTHTFGTGTVLKPFVLSDGSAILLAVDEWLTPNERVIWHKGIQPDIEVNLPPDAAILMPYEESNLTAEELAKTPDKQLLEALKVLREKVQ